MGTSSEGQRKQLERFVASQTGVSPELEEKEFFEKGNWENVTGHCLLEAARACVFADLLGFDADLKKDLAIAALLHDGYKRREIIAIQEEVKSGGSGRAASNAEAKKYFDELAGKGMSARVIRLMGFAGGMPEVMFAAKEIMDRASYTDEDLASLIVYYVDSYTTNDEWAEPLAVGANDADRRIGRNRENPNYKKINEEVAGIFRGREFFSGMDSFDAMEVVSHEVEKILSRLIKGKSGIQIAPLDIPEAIDARLKEGISAVA